MAEIMTRWRAEIGGREGEKKETGLPLRSSATFTSVALACRGQWCVLAEAHTKLLMALENSP